MKILTDKFKNKISKKTFACPQCSKKLRVPIRLGKTLLVSCPRCHGQINLSFKSPLVEFFKWEKGRSLSFNLKMFYTRFQLFPFRVKMAAILIILIISSLVHSAFVEKNTKHLQQSQELEAVRTI